MEKQFLVLVFVVFAIVGCGTMNYYSYDIEHKTDEFDGYTLDRMTGNYIKDSDLLNIKNSVWLNAQRYISKDGQKLYSLIVQYWDTDWLFINKGETLVLLIDGSRFGFSGEGSSDHRDVTTGMQGAVIKEMSWYDVPPDILQKISQANIVKIKVVGSTRDVTRELSSENISNFKRFVNEFVK
ncbi:MAG: hypothetical protein DAHOPDDO_02980 [Ignavibacteriaceae bacterium]|nr:hypothetical protein [Ignavibacteriaceae bacterium]